MASQAQILANRRNASASTGPRTMAGKAASAANAVKHGLASAFNVLAHEDQEEFDQLLLALRDYYAPRDVHESFLVDQMAKSQWLIARAQRLQTAAYNLIAGLDDAADPDTLIVQAMRSANPDVIGRLDRYAANAERSFYRAHREFNQVRQQCLKDELDERLRVNTFIRAGEGPLPLHPSCSNATFPSAASGTTPRSFPGEIQNEANRSSKRAQKTGHLTSMSAATPAQEV